MEKPASSLVPEIIRFSERAVLIALSAWVIVRMLPSFSLHPQIMLVLANEMLGVFFLLIQRRGTWTASTFATSIAFLGTGAALLIQPVGTQIAPEEISAAFVLLGGVIAVAAKLSLRRSFGLIPANRGVKKGGAYQFVRHPMYAGYVVSHVGFLMVYFSLWNVAVYATAWLLLYLRAVEEEKFLLADPEYAAYAQNVRARIIPGLI